jgi:GT2 family glycosyltransferase
MLVVPRVSARISVIVVNYRATELLLRCLDHIATALAAIDGGGEVLVIDNAATGEVARAVAHHHPSVRVLEESVNTGFSPAVARGTAETTAPWLALVNNDADVAADCFAQLLAAGESAPDVGSVAAQVRFTERPDVLNSAGLEVDRLGVAWERLAGAPASEGDGADRDVFGATGCVALYRRSMLDAIGGFDPAFFAYLEDVDVAWRARAAGWRSVYEPRAIAHHRGSATSREGSAFKYRLVGRNRMRLLAKNATRSQLLRYGAGMAAFDLAYVVFAGVTDRTPAPLQGRLQGLRGWRAARALGAPTRGAAPLAPARSGWLGALRQWRGYRRGGAR